MQPSMNAEENTETIEKGNPNDNSGLTIVLNTDEDDHRPVYLSGNFNNWATQDRRFMLQQIKEGEYRYTFPENFEYPEKLTYKFTKGDWSEVEIDRYGNKTPNRYCSQTSGIQIEHVPRWRKNWLPYRTSQLPQVHLISKEFEIPQLNKKRKIWALLPHDYDTSVEHYPVLYLQDAQNLFNENAPYGNWQIDKKLAVMSDYGIGKIIIIAIEHAEKERLLEYNVGKTLLGEGQGKKYIRFVTDTLKPFVDKNFRTKPEREYTGIGGSSMGGLVSIFSGLMYPEVYGKLMIFSPSLWVIPKIKFSFLDIFEPMETKIYLYAGGDESETMIKHVKKFKKRLLKKDSIKEKMKVNLSINMEGKHSETYWSDEFPKAIEWLFFSDREGEL
ncbi:alpha/beta hydrolase [Cecembia lonarensis]|uniref:Putative hydrolase of the alpha/beta superfamily protein n=1 Tax=Cecembia lonarensis (strain CCUG 58316 / KCTC 22772 / LW9) TaxID=1225176 RepID=K1LVB7_CECL9|nr:alpha/beta hydrolase-fold protein [Cecembia lonarensis]EKB48089.1 putative hydrolase of the alpha/beta superfamily protein [Cecembia lonarensis LW9]